jgi:hypothetical protein
MDKQGEFIQGMEKSRTMSFPSQPPAVLRPLRFVSVIVLGVIVVETIFSMLFSEIAPDLSWIFVGIMIGGMFSVIAAVLLTYFGWWRKSGLLRGTSLRNIGLFWPLLLYGLLPFAQGLQTLRSTLDLAMLVGVFVAFWQTAVLGMFVLVLSHHGVWRTTVYAALLFAVMHLGGILAGADPIIVGLVCLSYLFLGFAFVSLRLRTGVLWPQWLIYTLFLVLSALLQPTRGINLVPPIETLTGLVVITGILAVYGGVMLARYHAAPVDKTADVKRRA